MRGEIVNGDKMVDPEVREYFREFASRRWNQADICRKIGISSGAISLLLSSGQCSQNMKILLEKLYKNPEGNFSNLSDIQLRCREQNNILEQQVKNRINKYLECVQESIKEYQSILEKLMDANKKDFLSLAIKAKKAETKLLSTIKNKIKPHTLIKNKTVEDIVANTWDELDELLMDMSQSNRISDV